MFICTIIVVVANVRKTVYMQECMNYILLQYATIRLIQSTGHWHSACAYVHYCL